MLCVCRAAVRGPALRAMPAAISPSLDTGGMSGLLLVETFSMKTKSAFKVRRRLVSMLRHTRASAGG